MLFEFGNFELDESAYELRRSGTPLRVDKKVFAVLAYMLRRPGQLVTTDELITHVWEGRALSQTVLSGTISRVRKVLGKDEKLVVNVHGLGYRFAAPVTLPEALPRGAPAGAPFVGRGAELAEVRSAMKQSAAGRGRILAIVGEPGIGKTHLAEVSARHAGEDAIASAWAHCPALEACPPFWPIMQLLRGALRRSRSSATRDAVDRALFSLTPPNRSGVEDAEMDLSAHRMFDGIVSALQALVDERPWLFILDDLQWADEASLRFLAYVAPEIAHMRLVLIATARNTGPVPGEDRLAHVLGHRNCSRIELERLTQADVAEYVTLRLGEPHEDLSRAVFAKSEGNPFFMLELLRPLSGSAPRHADELSLPGAALDVVRRRVRALGSETVAVLSAAAVVGRDFDLGLLGHLADLEPQALLDTLERARQANVILSRADRLGHFAFAHELIRSVLLEHLSASEQAQMHLRVAEAIERRYPTGDGVPCLELVHHLLSALPLGDTRKAIDYAKRAATAAAHVCAHADAAALLRRALSALELVSNPDPRLRCDLLLGLALSERAAADSRFSEHLSQAAALGREHGLGEVLAEAGRFMCLAPGFTAPEGTREVLEAAERVLPAESLALRSHVLARLAWTAPYCFDAERVADLLARVEALALEAHDSEALASSLQAKLYFVNGPDSPELARAITEQIDLLYAPRPPLFRVHWSAQVEFSRIATSLQRGDIAAVEQSIVAFGAAARQLDHAELQWHHERACVVHRMNRGDFDGMKGVLTELHDRAEQLRLFSLQGVRSVDWAVLLRETEGNALLAPYATSIVLRDSDCPYRRARKIRSLAELGTTEKARAALGELPSESLHRLPHDRDYIATLVHLAIASVMTRSPTHSEALYALLAPYPHLFAADLSFHCDGSVSHFLGMLALSLGRTRDAIQHLEEALGHNERAGFAARAAHSAFDLACILSDSPGTQSAKSARELWTRALDAAQRMGMAPLSRRVERELRAS